MPYQNILVAVDLGATTETVIQRAASLANQNNALLHVLHVIEPLAITYGCLLYTSPSPRDRG